MHKTASLFKEAPTHFRLTAQILADNFADSFSPVNLFTRNDPPRLEGIRLFAVDAPLSPHYIYLLADADVMPAFRIYENISFLIAGQADISFFSDNCTVLQVGTAQSAAKIMNTAQEIFEKYREWDRRLRQALNSLHPLDDMLEASLDIFQNPVFAHDTNFFILSCPRHVVGMSVWERDSRTGRQIVPLNLIHEFKTDLEYLETLNTKGTDVYSEALRGYAILYRNLWVNGNYEGRICVDELQSAFLPGQKIALDYLGTYIELCIRRHTLFHLDMGNDTRQFFIDFLDGSTTESQQIQDFLLFLNWRRHDLYLCLRLENEQQNERMHSSIATLGHIEAQIPEGRAFVYQQGIVVFVNLSYSHSSISEVISGLAIILREGMFQMGASTEINDFMLLPQGYLQAKAALKSGKESGSMIWWHRFDDYLLEYILKASSSQISPELLCSEKLLTLKRYDQKNNTQLYETLRVYLNLERNVLQTAKTLFIHRSTLFYRLERIGKLIKPELDDPRERLILQLSYYFLEHQNKGDEAASPSPHS